MNLIIKHKKNDVKKLYGSAEANSGQKSRTSGYENVLLPRLAPPPSVAGTSRACKENYQSHWGQATPYRS